MSEEILTEMTEDTLMQEPKEVLEVPAETPVLEEEIEERHVVFEEALESILFAAGHPVQYATIARVLEMTPSKVKELTLKYAEKYNRASELPRGVILVTFPDSAQLCTKEYYLHEIREALGVKKSGSLSTSSMEALAIIAYNQPTTRLFVDTLRRADSSYAMNNLLDRGLIECVGRMDVPGRPMLYGTTRDFLRCFGLSTISELPRATEEMTDMFATVSPVEEGVDTNQLTLDLDSVGAGASDEEEEPSIRERLLDVDTMDEPLPREEDVEEPSAEDDITEEIEESSAEDDIAVEDDSE